MSSFTISWVRHGESIAQMIEGANDDAPIDKESFLEYRTELMEKESDNYKSFSSLESAFENIEVIKPKEIIPFDDLQKKMTEDKDFIKKNFNSVLTPSSWFFTPTLTSIGKEEAVHFGKSYLSGKDDKYDLIICSPTVRTILTALYALHSAKMNDKTIMIMPHINEEYITNKNVLERANAGIPVEIIDEIIELIKKYTKIDITINTDFYKENKKSESDSEYYNGNFEKAKTLIKENGSKILAFVHGTFITKRLTEANAMAGLKAKDKYFFPHNCSLYDITYDGDKTPIYDEDSGHPNMIADVRKDNVKDVRKYDEDYCSLKKESLRGEINYLWIDCYDKQGDYKCGNVKELKKKYEGYTEGGKKRRNKKTMKKRKSKKRSKKSRRTKRSKRN